MFAWIAENIGTIIICAVLIAIVAAIVIIMIINRKRGNSSCGCSCGCGCADCALNDIPKKQTAARR